MDIVQFLGFGFNQVMTLVFDAITTSHLLTAPPEKIFSSALIVLRADNCWCPVEEQEKAKRRRKGGGVPPPPALPFINHFIFIFHKKYIKLNLVLKGSAGGDILTTFLGDIYHA